MATLNPPSTIGRHELSARFTRNARVLTLGYPKLESLQNLYALFLP